jgi:hypothetical protein
MAQEIANAARDHRQRSLPRPSPRSAGGDVGGSLDDLLGSRPAQRVDIEQDAVGEDRRDSADVVGRHEITTGEVGRRLRSAIQRHGRPGAAAEPHRRGRVSLGPGRRCSPRRAARGRLTASRISMIDAGVSIRSTIGGSA